MTENAHRILTSTDLIRVRNARRRLVELERKPWLSTTELAQRGNLRRLLSGYGL